MRLKRAASIVLAFLIIVAPLPAAAATGCNFPASLDSWANKAAGDNLTQGDLNSRTCAIEKLEAALAGPFAATKVSCATPAYSFSGDTNTGIDSLGADELSLCAG